MSEQNSPDKKPKGYELFMSHVRAFWSEKGAPTRENLKHWLKDVEEFVEAAEDITKDELALTSAYVNEELAEFLDAPGGYQDSAFFNALQNTAWEWLLAVSDRTQIEQIAVEDDLHHADGYKVGEWMAPGQKICKQCGHRETLTHSVMLTPCLHCSGEHYQRQPLLP